MHITTAYENLRLVVEVLIGIGITFIASFIGWLLGRGARYLIVKLLSATSFDEWIRKLGIGKAIRRMGYKASEFLGAAVAWVIYIVSIVLGVYIAASLMSWEHVKEYSYVVLTHYIAGILKMFAIALAGFVLIDVFVGYIYRSTELGSEMQMLYPLAEYIRIVLYIAITVFAVEQSGLGLGILSQLLIPIIWGIIAIIILYMIYLIVQSTKTPRPVT